MAFGYKIETDFQFGLYHQETLIAASGRPAHAVEFCIPTGMSGPIRIRSSVFTPAEFSDGCVPEEDWRQLGIAISRLKFDQHQLNLGDAARQGVHPRAAGDEAEWTDGDAVIELPGGTKTLTFALQAFPKKWIEPS